MRYILGILFLLSFIGFVACVFLLAGPPSQVFELRDVILAGSLICALIGAVLLGILALGIGAKGRRISIWRTPLLCVIAFLVSFGFGIFILTIDQNSFTPEHTAIAVRLRIGALVLIVFGLFSLGSLIAALILAKRHNSKLTST